MVAPVPLVTLAAAGILLSVAAAANPTRITCSCATRKTPSSACPNGGKSPTRIPAHPVTRRTEGILAG